jgi:hypothetical protein
MPANAPGRLKHFLANNFANRFAVTRGDMKGVRVGNRGNPEGLRTEKRCRDHVRSETLQLL